MPRPENSEKRLETKAVHNALNNFMRFCSGSKISSLTHLVGDIQACPDKSGQYDIISAFVDKTGDYSDRDDLATAKEQKLRDKRDKLLQTLQAAGEVQICHFGGVLKVSSLWGESVFTFGLRGYFYREIRHLKVS